MAEEYVERELSKFGFGGPEPSPITNMASDLQILAAQRKVEEEAQSNGFWDLVKMRQLDAGTIPSVITLLDRPTPVEDERISPEIINELTANITDEAAVRRILEALESKGVTYARAISSEVRRSIKANETLAQAGLRGTGAMLLSDVLDPADAIIMANTAAALAAVAPVSAPLIPIAAGAVKINRLFNRFKDNKKYLAASMGVGAAELGGLEYLRSQAKYDITGGDVLLATTIGGVSNLAFTRLGQVLTKRSMVQRAKLKEASGEPLSDFETTLLRENNDDDLTERVMNDVYERGEFDVEDVDYEVIGDTAVGNAVEQALNAVKKAKDELETAREAKDQAALKIDEDLEAGKITQEQAKKLESELPEFRVYQDARNKFNELDKAANEAVAVEARSDIEGDFTDTGLTRKDIALMTPEEIAATPRQRGGLKGLRGIVSSFAKGKNSEDPMARLIADRLGLNSTGNETGLNGEITPVGYGANEQLHALQSIYRASVANPLRRLVDKSGLEQEDLFVAATRYVWGTLAEVPEEAKQVAALLQKNMNELFAMAAEANAAGFTKDMLGRITNYLPRMFDEDRAFRIRQTRLRDNPDGTLNEGWFILGEAAIREGQPNLEENVAAALKRKGLTSNNEAVQAFIKKMARGYMQGVINPRYANNGKFKLLDGNIDVETFIKMMEAEVNIDGTELFNAKQIEAMLEVLTRNVKVKGHPRSRPRMELNEMTRVTVTDSDGNLFTIGFNDLLEENISVLYDRYVFQLASAIGRARNGIDTNTPGSSFETLLGKATRATEGEINALRFMYDAQTGEWNYTGATIAGQPMSRRTKRWLARGREYGFATIMGMAGMSAIMEINNVIFETSLPTLMKTVPAYGKLIRRGQNGEFDSKLMRELAATTGVGSDGLISKVTSIRTREEGEIGETISARGEVTKLDVVLGRAREFVAKWSGLRGVTDVLRRLVVINYASEWAYKTKSGVIPFSAIKREQLGISDEMAQRFKAQIDEHATYFPDGTLEAVNLDRWSKATARTKADPVAAELFEASARREATQLVQEMNVGSVNPIVRSEVGKTFFQFLSFPMSSMEQQTMRMGVRAKNGDAAQITRIMLSSMFFGSLMYITRSYLNSMGRSDQDEYMKERMTWENLIQGSLSQVGAAALFGYIYQITSGTIDGNTKAMTPPVVSLIGSGTKGLADIAEAWTSEDKDLRESEVRNFLRTYLLTSLYGARQGINALADAVTVDK